MQPRWLFAVEFIVSITEMRRQLAVGVLPGVA